MQLDFILLFVSNWRQIVFTILTSFICFIPTILYFQGLGTTYVESIDSNLYYDNISKLLEVCLLVTIPVALDAVLDLVSNSFLEMEVPNRTSRLILALVLFVPTVIMYNWINFQVVSESQFVNLFISSTAFRDVAFVGSLVTNIPNYVFGQWLSGVQLIWVFMTTTFISRILFSFVVLFQPVPTVYMVFYYLFAFTSMCLSCIMSYDCHCTILIAYRERKLIPEEISGYCFQMVLSLLLISCFIVDAMYYESLINIRNISATYIMIQLLIQSIFSFLVSYIPGRISHFEATYVRQLMEEKLSFIRYISHEIRTPLNTVFLGIGFVKGEIAAIEKKQETTKYLESRGCAAYEPIPLQTISEAIVDVNESCQVALSILNDLLTVDKIESGKLVIEVEDADPYKLIIDVYNPFRVLAREKNVTFEFCVPENTMWWHRYIVSVDVHKFSQVIRNLISNALKFTPSGGMFTIFCICLCSNILKNMAHLIFMFIQAKFK